MTVPAIGVYAAPSVVAIGGTAVTIIYGPVQGGLIVNPALAADQGISSVEVLYIDVVGPAALGETATTVPVQPGQSFSVPPNQTTNVSVNAATSGHKFSVITFQPPSPVTPGELIGVINPCLQNIIPSYLYQQYADDDTLQAFVAAYNTIAQQYLTWFNDISLPVYTGPLIVDDLLDWVATGLYGVTRPVLSAGNIRTFGPFNTYQFNTLPINGRKTTGSAIFTIVNDDIYKRVLTWKLYKGDGKNIDIRWLKRRIYRFLYGVNGTDVNTANTTDISITFGGNDITITVVNDGLKAVVHGALFNAFGFNTTALNLSTPSARLFQTISTYTHDNQVNITLSGQTALLPEAATFQQLVNQGILDLPFQFKFVVNI